MLKVLMPSLNELISTDYKNIRSAETERLIEESLQGLVPVAEPELLQVSGIPGAGKSTYCTTHQKKNFLFLSFDKIMESLSGYQAELKQNGSVRAYQKYEMPARVIGYELLRRAVNRHVNIMFEHSGTNKAHLELFKNIKKKGYKTAVDFIICDTSLAVKRALEREKKTQRHVPETLILERAAKVKEYISVYKKEVKKLEVLDGGNNFYPLNEI